MHVRACTQHTHRNWRWDYWNILESSIFKLQCVILAYYCRIVPIGMWYNLVLLCTNLSSLQLHMQFFRFTLGKQKRWYAPCVHLLKWYRWDSLAIVAYECSIVIRLQTLREWPLKLLYIRYYYWIDFSFGGCTSRKLLCCLLFVWYYEI